MNDPKRLKRLIEVFEALYERDQRNLAMLQMEKNQYLKKQQDAFEFLACDTAFKYGIADEVVKVASRASADVAKVEQRVIDASAEAALRKAQLDRMKRKYRKAQQAAETMQPRD